MPPSTPSIKELERRIEKLEETAADAKSRVLEIKVDQDRFLSKLTKWYGIAAGVFSLLLGYTLWGQYTRISDAVEDGDRRLTAAIADARDNVKQAEEKYRALLDARSVKEYHVINGIDDTGTLYGDLILDVQKSDSGMICSLSVTFSPRFSFEVSTVNVLSAANVRYSPTFIDVFYGGLDFAIKSNTRDQIYSLDDEINAVAGKFYTLKLSLTRSDRSCDTLATIAEKLGEAADLGSIDVLPIYQAPGVNLPSQSFRIKVQNAGVFQSCAELGQPGSGGAASATSDAKAQ